MKHFIGICFLLLMLGLSFNVSAKEYNWSKWRGPDGKGISKETDWNAAALKDGPDIKWSVEVGIGYSNVSILGDRLYTIGYNKGKDTVFCLNFNSGDEIWKFSYPATKGQYAGPRATPVLDEGKVYIINRDGGTYCLDANDGREIWSKKITTDYSVKNINWGIAGSPVIYKDLLILNAHKSGLALNKKTGDVVWASEKGDCGYATPVIFKRDSKNYVAIFAERGLFIVNPDDGKQHAYYKWRTDYGVNAADPVITDEGIFITSDYGRGGALLKFTGAELEEIWENDNICSHFSGAVELDGYLYGIDGNTKYRKTRLTCIELKTGKKKWASKKGIEALTAAGDKLIVVTRKGELVIAQATPDEFQIISKAKVIDDRWSDFWTAPILCRGYIFVRSGTGKLVCVNMNQ